MDQTVLPQGDICTVEKVGLGVYKINSFTSMPPQLRQPESFLDVLMEWGCTWMWGDLRLTGDDGWVAKAINEDSLVAVTDGSYMRDLYPNMNSCAFILECTQGHGRLTGAFLEQTIAACTYRGELLGLMMAIHLILLSVNRINPTLTGSAHIYSDCLGALNYNPTSSPTPHPLKVPALRRTQKHNDTLQLIVVQTYLLSCLCPPG
jgi:hypothetical protein